MFSFGILQNVQNITISNDPDPLYFYLNKSDRSINKNVLNDHIRQRELIRDLTVEELELLQPFLTSKLAVYPYNFQSSL